MRTTEIALAVSIAFFIMFVIRTHVVIMTTVRSNERHIRMLAEVNGDVWHI